MENRASELEFLRYFHRNADFGPADSEVRYYINDSFMEESGKRLPEGYETEEEE